jgi:TRAP-type C4-dicarboxylate transport system permease small subunit
MNLVQRLLAWLFGLVFVALSFVVSVETLSRKIFNFSIQGADELGGYALAAGSVIAFSLALVGRNHIRVDVFHGHFGKRTQAVLNALSYVLLAVFAVTLAFVAFTVVKDTMAYGSTAPTPWQTPLIWPQSIWYAGLLVFALMTVVYAARAATLLVLGRYDDVNHHFQPKSVKEEVREEVDDFAQRSGALATTGEAAGIAAVAGTPTTRGLAQ